MSKKIALQKSLIREMREFIAGAIMNNQRVADRLEINTTDHQVLNLVDLLEERAKPGELARLTGLTTGGVTVSLDRLERAGYVKRERNPRDRRSVIVRMVPEQQKKIHALYKMINEAMARIFEPYDEKELATVLDFFVRTNRARADAAAGSLPADSLEKPRPPAL